MHVVRYVSVSYLQRHLSFVPNFLRQLDQRLRGVRFDYDEPLAAHLVSDTFLFENGLDRLEVLVVSGPNGATRACLAMLLPRLSILQEVCRRALVQL